MVEGKTECVLCYRSGKQTFMYSFLIFEINSATGSTCSNQRLRWLVGQVTQFLVMIASVLEIMMAPSGRATSLSYHVQYASCWRVDVVSHRGSVLERLSEAGANATLPRGSFLVFGD